MEPLRAPEEKWNAIRDLVARHYTEIQLESIPWGVRPADESDRWTLYVQPRVAIDISAMSIGFFVAARTEKMIQDLSNLIGMGWEEVW